jgi:hypothetical protein
VASQLARVPGQSAVDLVTVPVGAGGDVRLYHDVGSVRLYVDIAGYYALGAAEAPDTFVATSPHRVLDTRSRAGGAVGAGGTTTLTRAMLGLPADATAVVVNLTAVGATAGTYITAWSGTAAQRPRVSDLDVLAGETRAALATVAVGSAGLSLYNFAGSVQLIADVAGWYAPSPTGSTFVPITPTRIDTGAHHLGAGGSTDEQLVSGDGLPAGVSAALFTLTTTDVTANTYETAYPTPSAGQAAPTVSNLDVAKGHTDGNLVVVAASPAGAVRLTNSGGSVADIADLAGYFLPLPAGVLPVQRH